MIPQMKTMLFDWFVVTLGIDRPHLCCLTVNEYGDAFERKERRNVGRGY